MPASQPTANTSIPVGGSPADGQEDINNNVRQDLLTTVWWVSKMTQTQTLTGMGKVSCPVAGRVRFYYTSDTLAPFSVGNFQVFQPSRSGIIDSGSIAYSTQVTGLLANIEQYGGEFIVSQGDVLSLQISTTGSPSPALSLLNFSLRCVLTPRSNRYG